MHKTGTTSVQVALLNNAKRLEAMGYSVFVNRPQLNAKRIRSFDPAWLRLQVELAEKNGLQAVIFSAEVISTFSSRQLDRLVAAFLGYDVTFVACFRHWVNFLPSRWAQNCLRRDTQSFPAYLKNLRSYDENHIDARFDLVVKRMVSAASRGIRIVSYDNAVILGRLLPTCLSAFDLPQAFVERSQGDALRTNVRKDIEATELVRLFNGLYSRRNTFQCNELFMGLSQAIPVERFYDFHDGVQTVLRDHEALKNQLLGIIRESRIKVLMSRKASYIARWEKLLEEVSCGHVFNLHETKLFAEVPDVEFMCSDVELDDLPVRIQEEMAVAFGIGENHNRKGC